MFPKMLTKCLERCFLVKSDALKQSVRCVLTAPSKPKEKPVVSQIQGLTVQGWVRAFRRMKQTVFIEVTDGSSPDVLQIIIPREKIAEDIDVGASIKAIGKLVTGPNNQPELQADTVSVLGQCSHLENYPFMPKQKHSMDYIRQYLHLRPKTRTFANILRLRSAACTAITEHLKGEGFINIHTPVLTSNDCEGAGELFEVKANDAILKDMQKEGMPIDQAYFDTKAFLTVSGQLHLEAAARALSKVYTFGPAFRAENSHSRLHLSEFYMLESEMAFVDNIAIIMDHIEDVIKRVTEKMIEENAKDFERIAGLEPSWLKKKFLRITYDEAAKILRTHVGDLKFPLQYGDPLSKEHELFLVRHNENTPVFVTDWPKSHKPFYMKECKNDPSKVDAFDLLAPGVGEVVGGGVREDDYEKLKDKLPSPNLSWYLDLRKFGNVPTAGYGLGFERFLQCVLSIDNIKDAIPFPRWPHHCDM